MSLADKLINRFNKVKGDRVNFEKTWQEIADLVLPTHTDFTIKKTDGQRQNKNVYDTTAGDANKMLAATILGGMITPGMRWLYLGVNNMEPQTIEAKIFLDRSVDLMLDILSGPDSQFISQAHEFLLSVGAFGTACMFVEEDLSDNTIKFCTIHLSQIYLLEDKYGKIDTVFRLFKYSVRQAAQMWGIDNLHDNVKKLVDNNPDSEIEIVHIVMPREDATKGVANTKLPFASYYLDLANKHIIKESGFHEMPYIISRFYKLTGEKYGRSPAWDSLPNIKMLNVLQRDIVKTINFQAAPPMLVADDGVMMPMDIKPFGVVVGGLSIDGSPRVQPLNVGANPNEILALIQAKQEQVRQAFFVDSLIPKQGTPITATEAYQQHESFLRMLTPQTARFQEEFLNPIIERVFGLLLRSKKLGDVPTELMGKKVQVSYQGSLAKLQKQQDILAAQKYFSAIAPLAQLMPEVIDIINPDRFAARMADLTGLSSIVFRTPDELNKLRQQRAQQQQDIQMMQAAQVAGNVMGNVPQNQG